MEVMGREDKIVQYRDCPIRACNGRISQLMRGRGTGEELRELFAKLRSGIPGLVIRTSIITGLPGEGEAEFSELCEFLKEQRRERVGAFPFSPEEGTPAYDMPHVDEDEAQKRAQMVEEIQSRIMDECNMALMGKTLEVLVVGFDPEQEQFYGRTYADSPEIDGRVWIASEAALVEGSFVKVCMDAMVDGAWSGCIVGEGACI